MAYPLEYGDSPDTAAFNALNPVTRDNQTAVEFHGDFAIVRWDFSRAADRFYTVRDLTTGRDLSRTWKLLRNARKTARAADRHAADGNLVALSVLGTNRGFRS
jgi:hypothetical protein